MKKFIKNNWEYLLFGLMMASFFYFLVAWELRRDYLLLAIFFIVIVFPMGSLFVWVVMTAVEGVDDWIDEGVANKKKIKELEERIKELEDEDY